MKIIASYDAAYGGASAGAGPLVRTPRAHTCNTCLLGTSHIYRSARSGGSEAGSLAAKLTQPLTHCSDSGRNGPQDGWRAPPAGLPVNSLSRSLLVEQELGGTDIIENLLGERDVWT